MSVMSIQFECVRNLLLEMIEKGCFDALMEDQCKSSSMSMGLKSKLNDKSLYTHLIMLNTLDPKVKKMHSVWVDEALQLYAQTMVELSEIEAE